jgi:hypothetical protein
VRVSSVAPIVYVSLKTTSSTIWPESKAGQRSVVGKERFEQRRRKYFGFPVQT